jgi:hypothetical protein
MSGKLLRGKEGNKRKRSEREHKKVRERGIN